MFFSEGIGSIMKNTRRDKNFRTHFRGGIKLRNFTGGKHDFEKPSWKQQNLLTTNLNEIRSEDRFQSSHLLTRQ
jgi:hypothetical protein